MNQATASHGLTIPLGLVRLEPSTIPVVSVYADWRVSGRGRHEAPTVIEKQLREALATRPARSEEHASLVADAARISTYLATEVDHGARSVVFFASHGRGLWFAQQSVVPTDTMVHVGDRPRLLPFAEMVQGAQEGLIAMVDTEHLRLVDVGYAGVRELDGLDEHTWGATRISARAAWRTAGRQRAHQVILERYAEDVASAIADTVGAVNARQVAIVGAEEIAVLVRSKLPAAVREKSSFMGRIEQDATEEDVVEHIWPRMQSVATTRQIAEISRLLGEREYVSQLGPVFRLLENRGAGTVAFDPTCLIEEDGEALLRQALDQRVDVLVARAATALDPLGGVVAWRR